MTQVIFRHASAGEILPMMAGVPHLVPVVGPAIVCVRGPSRSGKTAAVERLIEALRARDLGVGYAKRTHHLLDLPDKASGRVWSRGPSAMALAAVDRFQVSLPHGGTSAEALLASLPADLDVVLLETHEPELFPTILADGTPPGAGAPTLGRWRLETIDADIAAVVEKVVALVPVDRQLDRALRRAMQLHGGHACAGLVLGVRLALLGAGLLGVQVPDGEKRLLVTVETDRCAVDAIQAVTGCRPGKRTLRMIDYGKLAATFLDQRSGAAFRVAVRGDLRERVTPPGAGRDERFAAQREAYLRLPADELFTSRAVEVPDQQFDLPGPPLRRVICGACGEEVSDGRDVTTEDGPRCQPCAARVSQEEQS